MKFSNRCFSLYNLSGNLLSSVVRLTDDHKIDGIDHKAGNKWLFEYNCLKFYREDVLYILFNNRIEHDNVSIFIGKSLDGDNPSSYILVENQEKKDYLAEVRTSVDSVKALMTQMNDTLGVGVRSGKRHGSVRKIVFLVHNIATWDSLSDVYQHLMEAPDFDAVVITINRRFPGEDKFGHEPETHLALLNKGIPHIRFGGPDHDENLRLLKFISPDGIFRQSPWDYDIPPEFHVNKLDFSNLFYIPYFGYNIVERFTPDPNERDFQADQDLHRACRLVFCESDITREIMTEKNCRGGDHFVATGHPKLEKLLGCKNNPKWPFPKLEEKNKARIIWAPHHSIKNDWLSFGIFPSVYNDMLAWVKSDQDIEIVLKPHPALFALLTGTGLMTGEQLKIFLDEWNGQENATIVEDSDYGSLMLASDIMLTDGISFLSEYMLFPEKPLIFMENPDHAPFNKVGKIIESACYIVRNVEETRHLLGEITKDGQDCKKSEREKVKDILLPFETGAAERIVDRLRACFE
ncbi:hypothetical protein HW511_12500 [Asaia siamensis]|uniref:CDP-Glycerol:Poly(Glycerophosphate) glycerophosphotransferase n=1 Tax=Asaia siamensis TaxID=110479 RepID=A0ABQ1MCG3_9PROT|nr:hypothetical protein [Asaia siamensis]GBR03644.1 hypothetical protein AA0323_0374 [Asaia siamensis NRIC 0323]GGC38436.1 hypothetical protein GCM10007207_24960 [Asaia siamensis]